MNFLRRIFERLFGRGERRGARAEPDAADFGTSFGLDMSLLPSGDAPTRPRRVD